MRGLHVLWIVAVCGLAGAAGCAKTPDFREFHHAAGKFKVQMPGTPKEQQQQAAGTTMNLFSYEQRNGAYMAAYADMPIPAGEPDAVIQKRLDGARDGMVKNINATLINATPIQWQGKYPGREVNATLPKNQGIMRARVIMAGTRMYQVISIGPNSWVDSADSAKFLDSLTILE